MDYKIENMENNIVKIDVTVSAEDFKGALKKSYEKNKEYFSIQGFRPGKAPYAMVVKRYGVEPLLEDAANIAINESYPQIVEEKKINVVDMPEIDITNIGDNEEFKYTAKVAVLPEFNLPEYKGLKAEKHDHPFDENIVEEEIKKLQQQSARIQKKEADEAIEDGDIVKFDFEGKIDGVPFEGGKADNYELTIGSKSFIGNFEEQMVGLKAGEEKDVVVTFPEEYGQENLNGKEAVFHVKINEISKKILPEIDDDFASEVSEFETLDDLRNDISKKKKEEYEKHMEEAAKENALTALVNATDLEVPAPMVERQIDNILRDMEQRLSYQGINLKQYYELLGTDEAKTRESVKDGAKKRVKTDLVMDKLIEKLAYAPTEEEVKELAESYAKQYGAEGDEKMINMLLEGSKANLEHDVKVQHALKELVSNVKFE